MLEITQLLERIDRGEAAAAEQLLPLIYDELRKLADAKLRCEQPGQTLDATALVATKWFADIDFILKLSMIVTKGRPSWEC